MSFPLRTILRGIASLGLLCAAVAAAEDAAPDSARLDEIRVLVLAPLDGRAAVQLPHHPPQVVEEGETLPGTRAVLIEVLSDRLLVEETLATEPPRLRQAWVHRGRGAQKRPQVQYLDPEPPPLPLIQKPLVTELELTGEEIPITPEPDPDEGGS